MGKTFEIIFAVIGAFVLFYAITHDGKPPHLLPRQEKPHDQP